MNFVHSENKISSISNALQNPPKYPCGCQWVASRLPVGCFTVASGLPRLWHHFFQNGLPISNDFIRVVGLAGNRLPVGCLKIWKSATASTPYIIRLWSTLQLKSVAYTKILRKEHKEKWHHKIYVRNLLQDLIKNNWTHSKNNSFIFNLILRINLVFF